MPPPHLASFQQFTRDGAEAEEEKRQEIAQFGGGAIRRVRENARRISGVAEYIGSEAAAGGNERVPRWRRQNQAEEVENQSAAAARRGWWR